MASTASSAPTTPGPVVLFIAFPSTDAPGLDAWTTFRDAVARGMSAELSRDTRERAVARSTAGSPIGIWRMVASNHREVARSAHTYPSFELAHRAVTELQSLATSLEVRTIHGPSSSTHGWAAVFQGRAVLTCARWYETDSASQEAAVASIAAFRSATVTDSPWRRASTRALRVSDTAVRAW